VLSCIRNVRVAIGAHDDARWSESEAGIGCPSRSLMNEPDLVPFDERTSALDTHIGERVMELIRSELNGRGTAAIVVTHDERMTHHCARVVRIVDGGLNE
jgi:ABC-type lipoprotein export system ATPase subunit